MKVICHKCNQELRGYSHEEICDKIEWHVQRECQKRPQNPSRTKIFLNKVKLCIRSLVFMS